MRAMPPPGGLSAGYTTTSSVDASRGAASDSYETRRLWLRPAAEIGDLAPDLALRKPTTCAPYSPGDTLAYPRCPTDSDLAPLCRSQKS